MYACQGTRDVPHRARPPAVDPYDHTLRTAARVPPAVVRRTRRPGGLAHGVLELLAARNSPLGAED